MRKFIIPMLLIAALGACSKAPESPIEPSEVIPTASPSIDWKERFNKPLTDEEIPTPATLKFGKTFTYAYGLKITVSEPESGKFTVTFNAPNGWVAEAKQDRSQVIVSTAGESQFSCDQPFSEDLLPGTRKTYQCTVEDFGNDTTDYIAVQAADFIIPMWTKSGYIY